LGLQKYWLQLSSFLGPSASGGSTRYFGARGGPLDGTAVAPGKGNGRSRPLKATQGPPWPLLGPQPESQMNGSARDPWRSGGRALSRHMMFCLRRLPPQGAGFYAPSRRSVRHGHGDNNSTWSSQMASPSFRTSTTTWRHQHSRTSAISLRESVLGATSLLRFRLVATQPGLGIYLVTPSSGRFLPVRAAHNLAFESAVLSFWGHPSRTESPMHRSRTPTTAT
jgi:hypothetical protein